MISIFFHHSDDVPHCVPACLETCSNCPNGTRMVHCHPHLEARQENCPIPILDNTHVSFNFGKKHEIGDYGVLQCPRGMVYKLKQGQKEEIAVKQTTIYCATPKGSAGYVDQHFGNLVTSCQDGCTSSYDCTKTEFCNKADFTCRSLPTCDVQDVIEAHWQPHYNDMEDQVVGRKIDISCDNSTTSWTETVVCTISNDPAPPRWLRLDGTQLGLCSGKKCSQDDECYEQICSQALGVCVDCEDDSHCLQTTFDSAYCWDNNCLDRCIDNKCVLQQKNVTCSSCNDCPRGEPNCIDGQCTKCREQSDCEEGMVCLAKLGLCLECLKSSDCPYYHVCTMGNECTPKGDMSNPCQECSGMSIPSKNSSCKSLFLFLLKVPIIDSTDCPKEEPNCIDGRCTNCNKTSCPSSMQCHENTGLCVECLTSNDCPYNHLCTMDHECKPRGSPCQDCRGRVHHIFTIYMINMLSIYLIGCPKEEPNCMNGKCKTCNENGCPLAMQCHNPTGLCVECTEELDCTSNQTCKNFQCMMH